MTRLIKKGKKICLLFFLLCFPFQLGKHFWPQWSYVLGLRVDYLSPTIWLTDIFLFLTLLFSLLEKLFIFSGKKRRKKVKKNSFVFLLFLLIIVNIAFAFNHSVAFFGWLKWLRVGLTAWLVYQERNWLLKDKLAKIICFWLAVEAFLVWGQWSKQASLGGLAWWLGERSFSLAFPGIAKVSLNHRFWLRPYGSFSHPNSLAGFVLLSLVVLDQINWQSRWKKLVFFLGGGIILFTFSRTAIISALIYLVVRAKRKYQRAGGAVLIIVFAFLLLKLFPNPLAWQEREQLIRAGWVMIKENFFLGVGENNFFLILPRFWQFFSGAKIIVQPVHNIFLLSLVQLGIVGTAVVIFLWQRFFSSKKTSFFWLVIFLTGMTDHYWLTLPQNMFLLGLILGLSYFF